MASKKITTTSFKQSTPFMHWEMFEDVSGKSANGLEPEIDINGTLFETTAGGNAGASSAKQHAGRTAKQTAAARESAIRLLTGKLAAERTYLAEVERAATQDRSGGYTALASAMDLRAEILKIGIEVMEGELKELRVT